MFEITPQRYLSCIEQERTVALSDKDNEMAITKIDINHKRNMIILEKKKIYIYKG